MSTARRWLIGVVAIAIGASSATWQSPAAAAPPPGAKVWKATHSSSGFQDDRAAASVGSPDGSTVFVTGEVGANQDVGAYATLAYDVATGARRWTSLFDLPAGRDRPTAIAVSPDGSSLFVTGQATGTIGTVAYNAATGAQRWASHFPGSGAQSVAVSPDGTRVYVIGTTTGTSSARDYVTLAYDAVTGAQLWARTYNGPAGLADEAVAIAVSPDGTKVVVAGTSTTRLRGQEYITIAYRATTGATLWFNRFNAALGKYPDVASAIAMSPSGGFVIVTGSGYSPDDSWRAGTVSYDMVTGAERWVSRDGDPTLGQGYASDVVVSPDAATVVVAGHHDPTLVAEDFDYDTVAYDAATGAERWVAHYDGPANYNDVTTAMAMSADGTKVIVTGSSYAGAWLGLDFATVAYDTGTGAQQWVSRFNHALGAQDEAADVVVVGGRVVAVGRTLTQNGPTYWDYALVAIQL